MSLDTIPHELKQLRQWVLWKKELRDGKATKIPYQITGKRASSENAQTWMSYEIVCEVLKQGFYDGMGFVFSGTDPYVGIDLDDCVVDGQLTEEATSIIQQLDSYSEYSPSGSGLHIILRASKPGTRCRKGNYEIYDHSRFFTMTGDHIGVTPTVIQDRQRELDDLYNLLFSREKKKGSTLIVSSVSSITDGEVLNKARKARNGKKFSALYNGDTTGHRGDDSAADLALCNMLAYWTSDVEQIDRLFRRSGLMRKKWERLDYRRRTIERALSDLNKVKRPDRLGSGEKNVTKTVTPEVYHELTDLGNSKRFVAEYGQECFYVYPFREWYVWNGRYWEKDQNGGIMRLAKKTAEGITEDSKSNSEAFQRHAKRSESLSAIKSMVHLAKPDLPVSPDQLDTHQWLLNVQNGTIDLKTGQLLPHNKKHYLTQVTPIACNSSAASPLWGAFLNRIMGGREDLIQFIQKAVGYSLTGSVREQCIFFLHGSGQNGKSTFLDILERLMGTYSKTLLSKSLMVKHSEGVNNDIAELQGARFVTTSEGEQGQYLAESLVKQLTGGDRRKARFLYGEYFEYEPTDKIWFMTNHKPAIKGSDEGIWRRIFLIPFDVSIPSEERDRDLGKKLLNELPGILNWAVEGCLLYQQEGLNPPDVVRAANDAYRSEMDLVTAFVEECCVEDVSKKVRLKDLYSRYLDWCRDNGLSPLSSRRLKQELKGRGYEARNSTGNQVFVFGLANVYH